MLAIIEQWEETGFHVDKTGRYLLLMLFKLGLDGMVFYVCCQKLYKFFLTMCSVAILTLDLLMVLALVTVWFVGAEKSLLTPCFILANASAVYGALPLPMILLGFLDYCSLFTPFCNQTTTFKIVRNALLTSLVVILAFIYTFNLVPKERIQPYFETRTFFLVCNLAESSVVTYFVVGLFIAVVCTMLTFCSMIPWWVEEADRISTASEQGQWSDMFSSSNPTDEECSEKICLEEPTQPRPPLWFSLILGFSLFWMPFLTVSVFCIFFGIGVPAYLTVNILWLECSHSVLHGLVFWVKSKTQGPCSELPENICAWNVFWRLSKQTRGPLSFVDV